ncbi:MAG: efflux RND transporter permease subunit [Phycisphaeraceae bacterium]
MKVARFSVARPVFTTMVVLIVLLLGGVSLLQLPIDLLPEVEVPTVSVRTLYDNASPEEMEELVTRVVEQAVSGVPGVEEVRSDSSEGVSNVRVEFVWGTNLDAASNDLRDRLDRVMDNLPDEADRPQLRKFDPSQSPVVIFGVAGNLDPMDLRELIDEQIVVRMEQMPGVATVDVWGGLEREIQVNIDADRIKAIGLPLDDVVSALRAANINVPAGSIERADRAYSIRTPGEFRSLDEVRDTVITTRDGTAVTLAQVATVDDTHRRQTRTIRINGEEGVRLAVRKQAETNTVQVAQAAMREAERINEEMPLIEMYVMTDQSEYIQQSINNVTRVVLAGGSLAILVLLFFLRNIRSTLVIATAIPISIIATFSLIYFGGLTLNLMTLGGLALGVGMMVDSSIVVLENIYRLREEGLSDKQAAVQGAEEVTPAIIASTMTTLAIFLPLVFLTGVQGVLFKQLAAVVSFALVCSLIVALTLVPMLASRLLSKRTPRREREAATAGDAGQATATKQTGLLAGFKSATGQIFDAMEEVYLAALASVLRWRLAWLTVAAGVFVSTLYFIGPHLGAEFMPEADEGEVSVSAEMATGTILEVVDSHGTALEKRVLEAVPDHELERWQYEVGASAWRPTSGARVRIRMQLVPMAERERSSEEVAQGLREALADGVPGMEIRVRSGGGLWILNRLTPDGEGLAVEIRGYDLDVLDALAEEVQQRMEQVEGVTDVRLSRDTGVPQELMYIDRSRAADMDLSVQQVARTLETALAGSRAGYYKQPAQGTEYDIRVRLRDAELMSIEEVLDLTVANAAGDQIVLRNVVDRQANIGPLQIERRNQQRYAGVSANISGRDLSSIAADVQALLREIPLPQGYEIHLAGDYEQQQEAFGELLLTLVLALLLVYMVMACLYESLLDPLIVMFSVPLAAIGVVLMLLLTDTTLNVQSFIGCIMLCGIVVNNAILIVDQAGRLREDGLNVRAAVQEAGRRRLRPILMTSLSTMLGLLPLALGIGEGADAQAPLARAVIGGLLSSTFITLGVIPIIYTLLHRERADAKISDDAPDEPDNRGPSTPPGGQTPSPA